MKFALENYAVDLEIAKELKNKGFPQTSSCWWVEANFYGGGFYYFLHQNPGPKKGNHYSAPISDEILKELPDNLNGNGLILEPCAKGRLCCVSYIHTQTFFKDEKLSNALAKLWIELKTRGYIE